MGVFLVGKSDYNIYDLLFCGTDKGWCACLEIFKDFFWNVVLGIDAIAINKIENISTILFLEKWTYSDRLYTH